MTILEIIGQLSNLSGAIGGVIAAVGVIKMLAVQKRQMEHIKVVLHIKGESKEIVLPLEMMRRDVSRAELLGRIGMLPMQQKGARFSLQSMASPEFMREINALVEGAKSTLVIPASKDEIDQFVL